MASSASSSEPPPTAAASDTSDGAVTGPAVGDDNPAIAAIDANDSVSETKRGRSRRHAKRTRLYIYALVAVLLSAAVVALAASNTAHAKVSWVIGSSHVSLVWMVLSAVVLGWLLGLLTAAALHRRTRAPH
jgi:uncharacterized integral membrane protein